MNHETPKQITQTLYITAWDHRPTEIRLDGYEPHADLQEMGLLYYGTVEVTVDLPALADPREQQIATLQKERDKEIAQSNQRIAALDEKIKNLQAITYQPRGEVA